jgi:hypothetical protein
VNRTRLKSAALVFVAVCAVVWSFGRAYRERRAVEDAQQVLANLGRMQEAHRRLEGAYTQDLSALADMTDDWSAFMESLNTFLDLRAGFEISVSGPGYRITAHARDRKKSVVVLEGPPKTSMAQAAKRR